MPTIERTLLAQGALYTGAQQLANVASILPVLCALLGHPVLAAVVYPIYGVGVIGGYFVAPALLHHARDRKHLVFAAAAVAMGLLFAAQALAATLGTAVSAVFLTATVALGVVRGITELTQTELIAHKLPAHRQNRVTLGQFGGAAVITILATALLTHHDPMRNGLCMLYSGAAVFIAAGAAAVFVGPVGRTETRDRTSFTSTARDGVRLSGEHGWFRTYLISQLFFMPTVLGVTFYTLHMGARSDSGVDLHVTIFACSAGLLIGSKLWRRIGDRTGVRGLLVASTAASVGAAAVCAFVTATGMWSNVWLVGLIFLLASMGNQAVYTSGVTWITQCASAVDRPTMRAFARIVNQVIASLSGPLFALLGQHVSGLHSAITMLGLCLSAAGAATRAPANPDAAAETPTQPDSLMPIRSCRRARGRGAHQLNRPITCMKAGTSSIRTRVASASTASARPSPNIRMNETSAAISAAKEIDMISAAAVMTRAVCVNPSATLSSLSALVRPERTQYSWMRASRKTS